MISFLLSLSLFLSPAALYAQDLGEGVDSTIGEPEGMDIEKEFLGSEGDANADAAQAQEPAPAPEEDQSLTKEEQQKLNEEFTPPKEAPYSEEAISSSPAEPETPYRPYEGLKKVTAKGEYQYNVKTSEQQWAGRFRVMAFSPEDLANTLDNGNKLYFDEIYNSSSSLMFNIEFEYQIIQGVGKLGITAGTGFYNATGNGRFKENPTRVAREEYSFYLMPNSLGAVYRLDYLKNQPVVPYGFAKGYYFTFAETRDDNTPMKYGGALATGFGGGAAILLDFFDQHAVNQLDNDSGVNHVYLVAEYEMIVGASDEFDFSTQFFSGGILVEF